MSDTPAFTSLAFRWLEASAGNLAPRSVKHYRWLLENYVFPRFGEVVFEEGVKEAGTTDQTTPTSTPASPITEQEVREFLDEMKEKGFTANTAYMPDPQLCFSRGIVRGPAMEFQPGKAQAGVPNSHFDPGTSGAAVDLPDRESAAEASGDVPNVDGRIDGRRDAEADLG